LNQALLAALGTPKPTVEQRELIMQALDYEPWPEQADFHFDIDPETGEERRHKLVTGGEQAGKSLSAAMELMTRLFWGSIFWIVAPDFSQAKNEFNYLAGWLERLGLLSAPPNKPDKGAWRMKLVTGQVIRTLSAHEVATIAGEPPDGILFVEAGQAPYEAFLRCYGRTAPKKGWLCINGTFEKDTGAWLRNLWKAAQTGKNHWRLKSFSIPAWSNRTFYPSGREDPEIVAQELAMKNEPGHFLERFGGTPSAPQGLVHTEFDYTLHVRDVRREGLLRDWEDNPDQYEMWQEDGSVCLPIDTVDELWIDPGFQHAYAVLFVTVFQETAVVYDELYISGKYSEQMADIALKHPRIKQVGRLIIDKSGQGHQGGNKAAALVWRDKLGIMPISRRVEVLDGVERCRISLNQNPETELPQLIFSTDCPKSCWEFAEGYKYPRDRWGNVLPNDKPEDINNDAVKCCVYGLTINFGPAKRTQSNRAQARKDRDRSGTGRTIGGWELLYDNPAKIGEADPRDWELDQDDDTYDSSYESEEY
jgi:hypothetical protein